MAAQEARLDRLAATERQLSAHVEQLKHDMALQERRIRTLKSEEQEALQRLSDASESLKAEEQNQQSEIVVLEQRRDHLGDQIRLDLLCPGEKERPATAERDGAFPDHHASSRPEDLETNEQGLRALMEQLTLQMAQLDEEKAGKMASMAAVKGKHRSAINQLVAEEVALRN
ncbi:hypothetical protein CRV24_003515 [Beauveria bassiana]|nr:hypothetical protein CRV24_003515 [Beauveria bassiana]KAH8718931.1 hypothetical protein HC256_003557 [Beauveria bassiana]